jgi:hypothetical protein
VPATCAIESAVATGRRLYVHDYSFRVLAGNGSCAMQDVADGLMGCRAVRVASHHLEAAAAVGALNERVASEMTDRLAADLHAPITTLLRKVAVLDTARQALSGQALLDSRESVVASCFDDGYWTFATNRSAASRMYADHEPLKRLYEDCRAGTGPQDLTMVKGARLTTMSALPIRRRPVAVPDAEWDRCCDDALGIMAERVESLLVACLATDGNPDRVIAPICQSLRVLVQPILRDGREG